MLSCEIVTCETVKEVTWNQIVRTSEKSYLHFSADCKPVTWAQLGNTVYANKEL